MSEVEDVTPLAISFTMSSAQAQINAMAQGADALERASKLRIVVFDKTGTLTEGQPAVTAARFFAPSQVWHANVLLACWMS